MQFKEVIKKQTQVSLQICCHIPSMYKKCETVECNIPSESLVILFQRRKEAILALQDFKVKRC